MRGACAEAYGLRAIGPLCRAKAFRSRCESQLPGYLLSRRIGSALLIGFPRTSLEHRSNDVEGGVERVALMYSPHSAWQAGALGARAIVSAHGSLAH